MSRVRQANELAIEKTIQFLQDLKQCCDDNRVFYVSVKAVNFGINKSTGKACKDLAVVKSLGDNRYKWIMANTNYRYIALLILEKLRERQQKTIDSPVLPNMGALIEAVNSLTEKLTFTSNLPKHRTMEPKTPSLFADQESKEAIRLKILCSITSGVYSASFIHMMNTADQASFENTNDTIILATEDLFKKFNAK